MTNEEIQKHVTRMATSAVEIAASFNITLDYTPDSIPALEEFFEVTYNDYQVDWLEELEGKKPRNIDYPAALLGCYLGEVLRKEINGVWEQEGDDTWALVSDKGRCYPRNKAWKRLTNGEEDNIAYYFERTIHHLK